MPARAFKTHNQVTNTTLTKSPGMLQVEFVPLRALKPSHRNARTHSKKQVRQIADSILQFGFTNPILVDDQNTQIAGHGRLLAASELGLKSVPVIVATGIACEFDACGRGPRIILQSPRLRLGEFESRPAKRLLQQYRPKAEVYPQQSVQPATRHPYTWAQQAPRRLGTTRTRTDADGSRAIRNGRFQRPVPQFRRQKHQS
jgi:hypothetical protein